MIKMLLLFLLFLREMLEIDLKILRWKYEVKRLVIICHIEWMSEWKEWDGNRFQCFFLFQKKVILQSFFLSQPETKRREKHPWMSVTFNKV